MTMAIENDYMWSSIIHWAKEPPFPQKWNKTKKQKQNKTDKPFLLFWIRSSFHDWLVSTVSINLQYAVGNTSQEKQ